MKNPKRLQFVSLIVGFSVLFDQLFKFGVRNWINKDETHEFIFNLIQLKNVDNTGAALGIGSNLPSMLKTMYFQLLPIIFLVYLFRLIVKSQDFSKLLVTGIAFTVGGGFGNIIDRILYGSVTDFVILNISFLKKGVFNIADVFIVIGIILVFVEIFTNHKRIETLN